MNSYQKLKKENEVLKGELDAVINRPDSLDAIMIQGKYKLLRRIEEAIFIGDFSPKTENLPKPQ